jgi:hypothetical protein
MYQPKRLRQPRSFAINPFVTSVNRGVERPTIGSLAVGPVSFQQEGGLAARL